MALANINGSDVVKATIWMPRVGPWHMDAVLDTPNPPTGNLVLTIDGGLLLRGTAFQSGPWLQTTYLRMVAGADGLRKTTRPKFYQGTSARIVLMDLLSTAGETLSATADASILSRALTSWTTIQQSVGNAVAVLAKALGASWRMLADGTLWIGVETWPDSGLVDGVDFVDIDEAPHEMRIELGVVSPRLLPGTTISSRHVSFVEHVIESESMRTHVMLEAA